MKRKEIFRRWERKLLRRILGGGTENECIRRTNEEIYESYQKPQIDSIIKARRLQWLGQIEKMVEKRTVRNIPWKTPKYRKKRGRSRKRWREAVPEDLKDKRIADWKNKATDRKHWKRITAL